MIKLIVYDFDGVFTNGQIFINNIDNDSRFFNGKDISSLEFLKKNTNVKLGIITSSRGKAIKNMRSLLKNLDFICYSSKDKLKVLKKKCLDLNIKLNEVCYIGDDYPDIDVIKSVYFGACPNDAISECKNEANMICSRKGGDMVVREFNMHIYKYFFNFNRINNESIYKKIINNKKIGKKIGFINGVFDLLHPGHIMMFKEIKNNCDIVVASIHTININKKIPIFTFDERVEILSSNKYIDYIIMHENEEDLYYSLNQIKPDVRMIGSDYKNKSFTGDDLKLNTIFHDRSLHNYSTSQLRNNIYNTEKYLKNH